MDGVLKVARGMDKSAASLKKGLASAPITGPTKRSDVEIDWEGVIKVREGGGALASTRGRVHCPN